MHVRRAAHPYTHGDILPVLNLFKATIVKLQSDILKTVILDTKETDKFVEEKRTVFHILQMQKRRTARTIRSVQDSYWHIERVPKGIMHAFTTYLRQTYDAIPVVDRCVDIMVEAANPALPATYGALLEQPIVPAEMSNVLRKGGRNKEKESDDIGLDFYKTHWATIKDDLCDILNQMFLKRTVTTQQKLGLIEYQSPAESRS